MSARRTDFVKDYGVTGAVFLMVLLLLTGCAGVLGFVTYYDPQTYKNLTELKPEVLSLYDTFTADAIDSSRIAGVRLKLDQVYEYEKGKGKKNEDQARQIKSLQEMFARHVNDRMGAGKWNEAHLNNQKENIAQAFDIAIQTERNKNKNE